MPMHFQGLSGMPRRIPDYPDGYIGWNSFITFGTMQTFISLIIFMYIVGYTIQKERTNEINNKQTTRWVSFMNPNKILKSKDVI